MPMPQACRAYPVRVLPFLCASSNGILVAKAALKTLGQVLHGHQAATHGPVAKATKSVVHVLEQF